MLTDYTPILLDSIQLSSCSWFTVIGAVICGQGRMQRFLGGGAKKITGANNAYEILDVGQWAPSACARDSDEPSREMCPTGGTFSPKPAQPGALSP